MRTKARRRFLDQEAMGLGRFINKVDPREIVGWTRYYKCDCGFACRAPTEIWDHVQEHRRSDVA